MKKSPHIFPSFVVIFFLLLFNVSKSYAQNYNEDDKAALRYFLSQPSAVPGKLNLEMLGLQKSVMSTWETDETWLTGEKGSSSIGVVWNKDIPKRIEIVGSGLAWIGKNLAGNMDWSKCTELKTIWCPVNSISGLTVSNNSKLNEIVVYENQLTGKLDLTSCTSLLRLDCDDNQLVGTLDVSHSPNLIWLRCANNQITQLNFKNCDKIVYLICNNNLLPPTIDVTHCKDLEWLLVSDNNIGSLDVTKNPALTILICNNIGISILDVTKNPLLKWLYCNNNSLSILDVTKNPLLEYLTCSSNNLNSLDLAKNTLLKDCRCSDNNITALDVTQCKNLEVLECSQNKIATLNTANPIMNRLVCSDNSLTSLDLSQLPALTTCLCNGNNIANMDITQCSSLVDLDCSDNKISTLHISNPLLKVLNCEFNKLKFSTLPPTSALYNLYTYAPQASFSGTATCYNAGVDLSSEYNINGKITDYKWFDVTSGNETPITTGITATGSGRFTFDATMVNKKLRCKMTNASFPDFSNNNTPLVYEITISQSDVNITTQPQGGVYGTKTQLTAAATGTNLTYQWYKNGVALNGKTSSSCPVGGAGKYYIAIQGTCGIQNSDEIEITKAPLTTSNLLINNKEYDGNTTASVKSWGSLNGVIGNDMVTITQTSVVANFNDAQAGNNKPVTISTLILSGTDAGNYTLVQPVSLNANITKKQITITGLRINDKVYDGNTSATINNQGSLTGIIGSDDVSISNTATIANFANPNASNNKPVTVSAFTLIGANANNYSISQPASITANITKAALTVTANNDNVDEGFDPALYNKGTYTISGFVNHETSAELTTSPSIKISASITSTTPNGIYPEAIQISGATAANYDIIYHFGTLTINVVHNAPLITTISVNGKNANMVNSLCSIVSDCGLPDAFINVMTNIPALVTIDQVQQNPYNYRLSKYGKNIVDVIVTDISYGASRKYTLEISKPIETDLVFYDRFSDVLTVKRQVLDMTFNTVDWYKESRPDDIKIARDPSKGYLQVTQPGNYYAILNGDIRTCMQAVAADALTVMKVYPNPAFANQSITIETGLAQEDVKGAFVTITDLNGTKIGAYQLTNSSVITARAPLKQGVYVIYVSTPANPTLRSIKLLVI